MYSCNSGDYFILKIGGIDRMHFGRPIKKIWKKIRTLILAGAIAVTGVFGGTAVHATDIKTDLWKLFYESEGNYKYSKIASITYYAGTNYYQNGKFLGVAPVAMLTCTGYNVTIDKTTKATKAYTTTFVPTMKSNATDKCT